MGYFLFVLVVIATVASPGPSTFLVVTLALRSGFRAALPAVVGILTVDTLFLCAGAAGASAVLSASTALMAGVKAIGVAYFSVMAIKITVALMRPVQVRCTGDTKTPLDVKVRGTYQNFFRAFFMHVANTKALLFFCLLVPQFIDPTRPLLGQAGTLLLIHLTIAAAILTGYALGGAAMGKSPIGARAARWFDGVSAVVMATLAITIAATA